MNPEVVVRKLRASFHSGKTRSVQFRKEQLLKLHELLTIHKDEFTDALREDLQKPFAEAVLFEVDFTINDVCEAFNSLDEWVKPEYVPKNFVNKMDDCYNVYEPLGVSLIIGAWNYPVQLVFAPLIGAIAAGNCALIKPSEMSPKSASLIETLISNYLDKDCYVVMQGAVKETTEILKCKFDHILYTGGSYVGKIVMKAGAEHLSKITLELGGKSPCYVAEDSDLNLVARRVIWGKFANAGQTCIAPDYVMCHPNIQDKLVQEMAKAVKDFFGEEPKNTPDFGRIINLQHFNRLKKLMGSGQIAIGGETDEDEKYIAPTVLVDVTPSDAVMQDEIFGPLLPIINVENVDEAIDFINCREKPLALYVFSNKRAIVDKVVSQTSSGGVCANDTLMYAAVDHLPFGGVGNSGIGSYHGKFSFEEFSHKKPVFVTKQAMEGLRNMRYPPYTDKKISSVQWVLGKSLKSSGGLWYIPCLIFGFIFSFAMKILGLPRYFLS